jgi:hypothetical protein
VCWKNELDRTPITGISRVEAAMGGLIACFYLYILHHLAI